MEKLFESIYQDSLASTGNMDTKSFFICLFVAILLGLVIALCYMFRNDYSKNLVVSIAVLPVIVSVLIMLVSGNLGAAVAVGGVFALTRFRSAQGTAREITHIFLAMAVGLTIGLGFVYIAVILVVIVELLNLAFVLLRFGERDVKEKVLKVTIPENLDYSDIFDDIFEKYTEKALLTKVKLANLGTMFTLTYEIRLKDIAMEKALIDEIRVRNGNLDILCSKVQTNPEEL